VENKSVDDPNMFSRRKHETASSREWDDVSAWLSDVVEAVEPRPEQAPIDLTREAQIAAQA
jgi:hypothetical protein